MSVNECVAEFFEENLQAILEIPLAYIPHSEKELE